MPVCSPPSLLNLLPQLIVIRRVRNGKLSARVLADLHEGREWREVHCQWAGWASGL
jgi:hypothetical protein